MPKETARFARSTEAAPDGLDSGVEIQSVMTDYVRKYVEKNCLPGNGVDCFIDGRELEQIEDGLSKPGVAGIEAITKALEHVEREMKVDKTSGDREYTRYKQEEIKRKRLPEIREALNREKLQRVTKLESDCFRSPTPPEKRSKEVKKSTEERAREVLQRLRSFFDHERSAKIQIPKAGEAFAEIEGAADQRNWVECQRILERNGDSKFLWNDSLRGIAVEIHHLEQDDRKTGRAQTGNHRTFEEVLEDTNWDRVIDRSYGESSKKAREALSAIRASGVFGIEAITALIVHIEGRLRSYSSNNDGHWDQIERTEAPPPEGVSYRISEEGMPVLTGRPSMDRERHEKAEESRIVRDDLFREKQRRVAELERPLREKRGALPAVSLAPRGSDASFLRP